MIRRTGRALLCAGLVTVSAGLAGAGALEQEPDPPPNRRFACGAWIVPADLGLSTDQVTRLEGVFGGAADPRAAARTWIGRRPSVAPDRDERHKAIVVRQLTVEAIRSH
jgi:hypothetical protein